MKDSARSTVSRMSETKYTSSGCCFPWFGNSRPRGAADPPTGLVVKQRTPDSVGELGHYLQHPQDTKLPTQLPMLVEELADVGSIREDSPHEVDILNSNPEQILQRSTDEGDYTFSPPTPCWKLDTEVGMSRGFTRSELRKPAQSENFFAQLLSRVVDTKEPLESISSGVLSSHRVDTTANEDCDVDVEEDIPFVAPELVRGIKALLARAEIQALREKRESLHLTVAQRKLGQHYHPFMRAIAELEQQTNRGFDWSTMLLQKQAGPQSPRLMSTPASPSNSEFRELLAGSDVHPLIRDRTVRHGNIMPVVPVLAQGVGNFTQQLSVQDPLTARQMHNIHREIIADAKRDAQQFGEELDLNELSFRS